MHAAHILTAKREVLYGWDPGPACFRALEAVDFRGSLMVSQVLNLILKNSDTIKFD